MDSIQVASIICPGCHAELQAHLDLCPHCRTPQRVVAVTPASSQTDVEESMRILHRPWVLVVLLLHVGFLGIPLYWRTRYSLGTRVAICLVSIAYTVFVVGFVAVVGSWLYRVFTGGG